jgi:16S rRNA (adenine1518-N6/adenine1519-N6)-dimethyltransferase
VPLLEETIKLSKKYNIKPTSARGQSFLIEEKAYEEIIDAAQISQTETVLEIGPGLGFLTMHLAKKAKEVIAVELDRKLSGVLRHRLEQEKIKNVFIFNEDVMNFTGEWTAAALKVAKEKLIVVANLPYTITSIFLRFFIGGNMKNILPSRFILMLQKEVAERLTAKKGAMSILAISVQLYCEPKIIALVPKKSFWPVPKVDSAVVSLVRTDAWLKELAARGGDEKSLLRLVKVGFSARRKMLKANLAGGYKLPLDKISEYFTAIGINPSVRAQELGLDDWLKLLPFFS